MIDGRTLARLILSLAADAGLTIGPDLQRVEREFGLLIEERFGNPILPDGIESVAVSLDAPKTSALFFDRIWWCPALPKGPPRGITVYGATEEEVWTQAIPLALRDYWDWEKIERVLNRDTPMANLWKRPQPPARAISEILFSAHGISALPVYASAVTRDHEYKPGNTEVIMAAVQNLNIVDEHRLQWDQVLEFRSDPEATTKYRRIRHWFDSRMVGKPVSYISDELAIRLDDYEWSLKKHGIETVVGSLSDLIEARFLTAASAATAGLSLAGGEFWAALGAMGLLVGKAAVSVTKKLIDIQEKKRGENYEVAFVHEVKKRLC